MPKTGLIISLISCGLLATALADTNAELQHAPPKSGQIVALRAVSALFIEFDLKVAQSFLAPDAVQKEDGPRSAFKLIDELKTHNESKQPLPAIKEVIFFTAEDLPSIRNRFKDDIGVTHMIRQTRLPAHLQDAFGCLVVTYPLQAGDKGKSAVIALVFNKIAGEYKITYVDDN